MTRKEALAIIEWEHALFAALVKAWMTLPPAEQARLLAAYTSQPLPAIVVLGMDDALGRP